MVGGVENQLKRREWCKTIEGFNRQPDLFGRPNLHVWGGYVMLVLWSCTVFRAVRC